MEDASVLSATGLETQPGSNQPSALNQNKPMPTWAIPYLLEWLQRKISTLISRWHLLRVTQGRGRRWQHTQRKLLQTAMALLLANGMLLYPLGPSTPAHAAAVFIERSGADNPLSSVDVGYFSVPSFVDINGDGKMDLFVGAQDGNVYYYANTGSATNPTFTLRTGTSNPLDLVSGIGLSTPTFVDIDGDGNLDAFVGGYDGKLRYYENTGSATNPAFVLRTGTSNPLNINGFEQSDPTFVDIDGDGDMDAFVSGYLAPPGYISVHYYENTGTATSPAFVERTGAANPLDLSAGPSGTPTFVDMDGDGDMDGFIGYYLSGIRYFENTGNANVPAFSERTGSANPLGLDISTYAAPSFVDIDGDGDMDAFIGCFFGTIKYYQNSGNNTRIPLFNASTTNPLAGVNVSGSSKPSFVDIDGDGDMDAFIGGIGGYVAYYENTGTATSPAFVHRGGASNPLHIGSGVWFSSPSFVDIDGNGAMDVFVGEYDGNILYYENTGSAINPAFIERVFGSNPLSFIGVGFYSNPSFVDIDGDGDMDAFISGNIGNPPIVTVVHFYENTGTATSPAFIERTGTANPLFMSVSNREAPKFVDIDGDGDMDAFIGEGGGTILYFENTGSSTSPAFILRSGNVNPFNLTTIEFASPCFVDIDGDGDMDAFVGNAGGKIQYYKNTSLGIRNYIPLTIR
jgi:hypothetical protein